MIRVCDAQELLMPCPAHEVDNREEVQNSNVGFEHPARPEKDIELRHAGQEAQEDSGTV